MAENLNIPKDLSRKDKYEMLYPQIKSLLETETDLIANMANISAALKQTFDFFWVGFYLVRGQELVLGPFQGPIACTRIQFNRGVCGHCYSTKQTVIVPDVVLFPGHIACNSASKSEIVVPVFDAQNQVLAVLDVDSDSLNDFTNIDEIELNKIVALLNH